MKAMKKILSVITVLLLTVSLTACNSGSQANTSSSGAGTSASISAGETTGGSDTVTLTLNHVGATDHPYHIGAERFAELVEQKSGGSLKIDVYPASQIASGAKAVEYVQMGTLDIALEATTALVNFVPIIGGLDMPFLFKDKDEVFKVLDGEVGQELCQIAEDGGFKILAWWDNGFKTVSNNSRPITSPDDYAKLKIRVPESEVFLATYEALGAVPTAMAVSEVYTALQTGIVDGQDNTVANFKNNKYSEIQKYLSLTNHIYTAEPLIMSTDKFYSLSEDHQSVLLEAAREACTYQREVSIAAESSDIQKIRDAGVEINAIEDPAVFRAAVEPVYAKYTDRYGELVNKIEAMLGED